MASQLQGLYAGARSIYSFGVGGQTSTEIAARQGGVVSLFTLAGNAVPASGPVAVTAQSVVLQKAQGPGDITGTLAGVHGVLKFDGVSAFTYTRDTAGALVAVSASEPFVVDRLGRDFLTSIFWYGRNNFADPTQVKADLAASVAALAPGNTRFAIVSVTNAAGEGTGTSAHATIVQLNADLAATYPANFIEVRSFLVGKADLSQPQDAADYASDIIPSSLRSDPIHLNPSGSLLVAQKIKDFLDARGW